MYDVTYHRNSFLLNAFDQKLFKNLFKIKCELLFFKKIEKSWICKFNKQNQEFS